MGETSPMVIGWRVRESCITDAGKRCLLQCLTACPLVSSWKTKPYQLRSVRFTLVQFCCFVHSLTAHLLCHVTYRCVSWSVIGWLGCCVWRNRQLTSSLVSRLWQTHTRLSHTVRPRTTRYVV